MAGPLAGVRILDFTTLTAGGEATGYLCDLGAAVIKVEPHGGEVGRRLSRLPSGESAFFLPQNRGKRSIVIDLKQAEGRDLALRLGASCDAVVHNFRVGAIERLGLGYEDFRALKPDIIYAECSGYGPLGPDAELESVDILGQARSGAMSVTGDDYPTPAGYIITDFSAAMQLAIGLLSALVWRMRTGEGQKVQTSMLGAMVTAQGWELTHYLVTGEEPAPGGRGHHLFARGVWGVYETADGHIVLSGLDPGMLEALASELGAEGLRRFAGLEAAERARLWREVIAELRQAFRCHPTQWLYETLLRLGVRCAPAQNYSQVARDPQVIANNYIVEIDHPRLGRTRMTGNPQRFSATPIELATTAPGVGEHTREVAREAGLSEQEIAALIERKVIAGEDT
ncbi:MAG TPA: CoA transferase [Dehalococcoidia bacterium]|nr:CoA transferase [Dehalococcoidia bacterium]